MEKISMNTRQLRVIAFCFLLLALSIPGFAQDGKQQFYAGSLDGTTGLFKTWDAENLQRGEFNISLGYDRFHRDPGQLTIERAVTGAAFGVVNRFEVFGTVEARRIAAENILYNYDDSSWPPLARTPNGTTYFTQIAPYIGMEKPRSIGDIRIGLKFNVLSERRGNPLSFGVVALGTIPTNNDPKSLLKGATRGTYDGGLFFLFSKTAFDTVRMHGNLGYNVIRDQSIVDDYMDEFRNEIIWRYGMELPVNSSFKFIAEVTGTKLDFMLDKKGDARIARRLNEYSPLEAIGGIRYYPAKWVSLGAAYQASIHHFSPEPAIQAQRGGYHGVIVQGTIGKRRDGEEPTPLTVNCSISRPSMLQDEIATIRASATDPRGGKKLTYTWSASGGNVKGNDDQAEFSASTAGTYTITVNVSNGKETASCSSRVTVNAKPAPAVAPTASIEPATFSLLPGESTQLRCVAKDANNANLTYAWTVNNEKLAATGPQITFGSEGRNPGSYDVTCTVSNGSLSASATAKGTIREKPNQSPTISCQTTTVSVASGSSVQLRASASDPDGDRLTYSWSSPAGAVSGSSDTTTFNAAGVRAGNYNVSVSVDDGRGGKAACSMTVNVTERLVVAKDTCGYFTAGSSRVDNCAKAILDDLAVRMRNDANLRANVYGYVDNTKNETANNNGLGEARAKAVAAYMQERGIDSSRIQITNGGVGSFGDNANAAGRTLNRRVEITLSPR